MCLQAVPSCELAQSRSVRVCVCVCLMSVVMASRPYASHHIGQSCHLQSRLRASVCLSCSCGLRQVPSLYYQNVKPLTTILEVSQILGITVNTNSKQFKNKFYFEENQFQDQEKNTLVSENICLSIIQYIQQTNDNTAWVHWGQLSHFSISN